METDPGGVGADPKRPLASGTPSLGHKRKGEPSLGFLVGPGISPRPRPRAMGSGPGLVIAFASNRQVCRFEANRLLHGRGRRQTYHGLAIDRPGAAPGRGHHAGETIGPGHTAAAAGRFATAWLSIDPVQPQDVATTPARRSARVTRPRPPADSARPGYRSTRCSPWTLSPRRRDDRPELLGRGRVCRRASWSRPQTRSPGRCRRGASRGRVADRCGPGPGRDGRGQDLDRFTTRPAPTCILVEALDTFTWSMPAGSFTRPGCRPVRTRTRATRPRGRTSTRSHAAVCRRASWSRPPTHSPGRCRWGASRGRLTIGADQDQGDTTAGRTSTRSHVAVCRRASWSRPSTHSPGRCRRGASRGRVADRPRCGPGPGRHGRGQDLDTLPRGRLPTCILVETLDTLTMRPAPTCILVEALDTLPPVDAGGELHTAGWSIGRGSEQRPARQAHHVAGYRSAALQTGYQGDGRGQDLHTLPRGRGCRRASWSRPRQLPLVDAGGEVHAAGLSIGADQGPGDTAAGRTSTRSHVAGCRRASWSRPSTASPGRCRRRFSIRPVLDRPGGRPWTWTPRRRDARPFVHRGERDFRWVWTWTPRRRDARPGPPGHGRGDGQLINPADPSERIEAVAVFPEEDS